ncbi:MAG: NAD(P)-binding protein [Arcobacteraceae bacterium]
MNCSKIFDLAIIGSGIGGSLLASLNQDKRTILFEKDSHVGGCASTFKRFGNSYNTAATTFVGYENGHIIKKMFDSLCFIPNLKQSSMAMRVIQENTIIDRTQNFETFLEQINNNYPNPHNQEFWETVKEIDEKFWKLKHFYYSKKSLLSYAKTALFVVELLKTYKGVLFKSAKGFIADTLGEISNEYKDFINAQLLITVQSSYEKIPLLSMALGLAYPFHKVYYIKGGMGNLIEELLANVNVHTKEEVLNIYKDKKFYRITTSKKEYCAYSVVLNSTVYDSHNLFTQKEILSYYKKFAFNDQSAFMVYLTLDSQEEFLHHYQILLTKKIPNTISNSFFISFSDKQDALLSKNGYSITISCHTKASFWENLNPIEYAQKKEHTEAFIVEEFLNHFKMLTPQNIVNCFSGTAKTFKHYALRSNCGGNKLFFSNFFKLPTTSTPFKGLYNIGDTVFSGQGWPGIALGVDVLNKELNE